MGGSGSQGPISIRKGIECPSAFIAEERDLSLVTSTSIDTITMASTWDYGQLTRPPYDPPALDNFYRQQRLALVEKLIAEGIFKAEDVPQMAFRGRYYSNPVLGQSLQQIKKLRYGPEYMIHPVEPFKKGGQADMVIVRLDYDLGVVNEHLSGLLYQINDQKRQEFPEVSVEVLLEEYDNLLDEIKREVPTFIPNY